MTLTKKDLAAIEALLGPRFDAIDCRFEAMDGRSGVIEGRLGAHESRFGTIEAAIADMNNRMMTNFDAIFQKLETFSQGMTILRSDGRHYENRIGNLEQRVFKLETKIA